MRRTICPALGRVLGVVMMLGIATGAYAQSKPAADADLKKLADDFMQAWAKGDAKALAALHTQDAIRVTGDGQVASGRATIEQNLTAGLATLFKGSTLVITPGRTTQLSADVAVGEGRYELKSPAAPAGVPTGGSYLNTYVRQGGRWLIAGSAVIPPQTAPPVR